jgi:hypothetical protein
VIDRECSYRVVLEKMEHLSVHAKFVEQTVISLALACLRYTKAADITAYWCLLR